MNFVCRVSGLSPRDRVRAQIPTRCSEKDCWVIRIPQEDLEDVPRKKDVWVILLSLLLLRPGYMV